MNATWEQEEDDISDGEDSDFDKELDNRINNPQEDLNDNERLGWHH